MLITISIYKGYLPSSPTTAKFEALLPTPRILLHKFKFSFSILIGCGGNFSTAIADLVNRGQKAFFKVKSIFKYGIPSIHIN
jgi:hypothetical protein